MREVIDPASIPVEVPFFRVAFGHKTPMFTEIFRRGVDLSQALDYLDFLKPNASSLNVVSAGCSVGAEVDSIIAIHKNTPTDTRLTVTGIDNNPLAVSRADEARYLVPLKLQSDSVLKKYVETLTDFGFESDFKVKRRLRGFMKFHRGYFDVSAAAVRAGHEVNFIQHDLSNGPYQPGEADAVFANNILFHFKPDEATVVLKSLAMMLKDSAMLSIGDKKDTPMGPGIGSDTAMRANTAEVSLHDWLEDNQPMLESEFGLQPKRYGTYGQPTIFARG